MRASDTAARLGGDEFALLLEDVGEDELSAVIERVMDAFKRPFPVGGNELSVRASVGVAVGSDGSLRAEHLLRNADVAMYTAKNNGKGTYAVFEPNMHAAVMKRHALKDALRTAVEQDEFTVHYQPIVQLNSGDIVAVEALVRWEHPEGRLVSPGEFIPMAEETGLIVPIGRTVLLQACRQARTWQDGDRKLARLAMHVNLSPQELAQPDVADHVAEVIRETGIEPDRLVLEITESGLIEDTATSVATLEDLRRLGVRLALDDFGTGYSSLSYLRWLPIDILKMAKGFVDGTDDDPEQRAFAGLIAEMARTLRLQVVAEGIETRSQFQTLLQMGCEMGQGFYFTKPLEPEALQLLRAYGRENLAAAWEQAFDSVLPRVQDASLRGLQGA
jgi:predicted signal transduction protein with EAL and GGDEF domain